MEELQRSNVVRRVSWALNSIVILRQPWSGNSCTAGWTGTRQMKIDAIKARFSTPRGKIRNLRVYAMLRPARRTSSHGVINVLIACNEWALWQAGCIEHARKCTALWISKADMKIVLESDVGFRATSPTADVITCCSVASKAVVLKYISSSIIHRKCDAIASSPAKEREIPVIPLRCARHGCRQASAIMNCHVVLKHDAMHGTHLPLLSHIAVGDGIGYRNQAAAHVQQVKAVLRIVVEGAVIAGEVQLSIRRSDTVPVAPGILIETTVSRHCMGNGILFVAPIPLHPKVRSMNDCAGSALRSSSIVKIPSGRTVECYSNMINREFTSDSADDAIPSQSVNIEIL